MLNNQRELKRRKPVLDDGGCCLATLCGTVASDGSAILGCVKYLHFLLLISCFEAHNDVDFWRLGAVQPSRPPLRWILPDCLSLVAASYLRVTKALEIYVSPLLTISGILTCECYRVTARDYI